MYLYNGQSHKLKPTFFHIFAPQHPSVVPQSYFVTVMDEHVLRGNAGLLKCHIPSFVSDFVSVVGWLDASDEKDATEWRTIDHSPDNSVGIYWSSCCWLCCCFFVAVDKCSPSLSYICLLNVYIHIRTNYNKFEWVILHRFFTLFDGEISPSDL